MRPVCRLPFALTLALSIAGCGGDEQDNDPQRICEPGATQSCVCGGGAPGGQVCAADGLRWLDCDCVSTDAGNDAPQFDAGAEASVPDAQDDANDQCVPGQVVCDGKCADLNLDPAHCGGCGYACSQNHIPYATCWGGRCNGLCEQGFDDCDENLLSTGCETDLRSDLAHCGACGNSCTTPHLLSPACVDGVCAGVCEDGFADCNDELSDGCERDLRSDLAACGACGVVCGNNHATDVACIDGQCRATCDEGFADCNNDLSDGCEADLSTDPDHCGACGDACSGEHMATRTCGDGLCNGACEADFGDCNQDLRGDGCEVDLQWTDEHCGACGNDCVEYGAIVELAACYRGVCAPDLVPVTGGYYIDATEVTQRQYQEFLATNPDKQGLGPYCQYKTTFAVSGICAQSAPYCHPCGHPYADSSCGSCGTAPQTCVDWCDAHAFCQRTGKRLCGRIGGGAVPYPDGLADASVSEYYNACSSGGVHPYPYGDVFVEDRCVGDDAYPGCGQGTCATVPIWWGEGCVSFDPGYEGVYGLTGNAAEWVDSCDQGYCAVRGGSVESSESDMHCDSYFTATRLGHGNYVGFRCCADGPVKP